ncbi:hypothetical protein MAPG_00171 [Magnaporthiopsis poae ATCC 64411]|uniref:C2H2 type zinc finger domain-containing protein n=1 Tax=Magnaporthiopsis poae (strain ATCC 64411 / 73-15) TaxID=644358 RepID=A0A0C4DKA6_MAGP6|nr:hypothetical protein MAPG_00171 [Magnaporthiopsis poae ATCC 64411]
MGNEMQPTPASIGDGREDTPTLPGGRLECPHCSRRFLRPSHLDRHRLTHLPQSQRLLVPCGVCDKSFGRKDVLLRHLRAAHGVETGPKQPSQRSCNRCVQQRRRCDRAQPCQLCAAAGTPCSYPPSVSPETLERDEDGFVEVFAEADRIDAAVAQPETTGGSSTAVPAAALAPTQPFYRHGDTCRPEYEPITPCDLATVAEDHMQRFLSNPNDYHHGSSEGEYSFVSSTLPFITSLSPDGQLDFRGSGLDWLDFHVPGASPVQGTVVPLETGQIQDPEPAYPAAPTTLPALRSQPVAQSWPFDQTQDPTPNRRSLPPLRDVLQSAQLSSNPSMQAAVGGLVSLMSEPRLRRLDELADASLTHAAALARGLVDVYLARFHPILPLLHVPTWDVFSVPTVLVAAMACIGALVSDHDHAPELAASISEICMPIIAWLGSSDTANYRDISYLNALCLHQIYSLGSGNRQLYQNADRSRGILIGSLRGVGYLTTRLSIGAEAQDPSPTKSVPSILKAVLSGRPAPPHISYWGKRLCAQIIGRLLWDLKQLEILSTPEHFGLPTLFSAQQENRVSLLNALDSLLASMDQPASTADLISYNIASLICHYSHLYTARDTLDIMIYIVRNAVCRGSPSDTGIQMAERRLQATLARDPQEARRLVHRAAQIIVIANDYLVSAPCEIMRLFMGYMFIIAFAKYCPPSHRYWGLGPAVCLDLPAHRGVDKGSAVSDWIEHGGAASIGDVSNIFSDGAALSISRDARNMLQRLKCWGLAEKFTKILQSFESTVLVERDNS